MGHSGRHIKMYLKLRIFCKPDFVFKNGNKKDFKILKFKITFNNLMKIQSAATPDVYKRRSPTSI